MRMKTPQEKKALSYAKDRRNVYGENDKTSRKAIRRNKTFPSRAYRKAVKDVLQDAAGGVDLEKAELIDVKAKEIKRRRWKKFPDAPLGEFVKSRLGRRKIRAGNGKTVRKKIRESLESLFIEIERETDGRWIAEATELNGVLVYGKTREDAIEKVKALARCVISNQIDESRTLTVS